MQVSVVIPTYNGAQKIVNLLRALENQTVTDFEVVVVVDGSTDDTLNVLKEFQADSALNLRVISQSNGGRAVTRNRGAKEANGDLLVFFDDDTRPESNCVQMHVAHHSSYSNTMLVGGLATDNCRIGNSDFLKYRSYIEDSWVIDLKKGITTVSLTNYIFTTANLSVSTAVFHKLNGFDKCLNDSEDFDFSMRAIIAGTPIYYNYHVFAWHDDFSNLEAHIRRQIQYKQSKTYLSQLRPEYIELYPASFNHLNISPSKRTLRDLFVYNKQWRRVLKSGFFLKLPKKIRFYLYSVIIHSSSVKNLYAPQR